MSQRVELPFLLGLQQNVENIRNFCILAHVDHGKTTLSDSLVSSNGIISSKLAGQLRFLDSTEEEQKRGITMHSSAIALHFRFEERGETSAATATATGETAAAASLDYLINLVDSPGHIDFSSEVSTAARLCDGALIIVDVLEGVCTQTHAVIYKALRERMRPCLVLNKIDRLIAELRFSPTEIYHHLCRIIENVNAVAFTLVNSEYIKLNESLGISLDDTTIPDDDPMVADWTFSPEKGNVQFASAIDGWGFGLMKFINTWHKKLGLNKGVLKKYLFEDYSLNLETKKITKIEYPDSSNRTPMFAALVLEPICKVYDYLVIQQDLNAGVEYAKNELKVTLTNREINPRDLRSTLQAIMRKWLPLADSLLRMVIRTMPNPIQAQQLRVSTLLDISEYKSKSSTSLASQVMASHLERVTQSVANCQSSNNDSSAPLVVFISKMMPVRYSELVKRDQDLVHRIRLKKDPDVRPLQYDDEVFVAVARVFSGTLRRDSSLCILGHKYNPMDVVANKSEVEVEKMIHNGVDLTDIDGITTVTNIGAEGNNNDKIGCYVLLGPSIAPAESVSAGNIVGIVGLDEYILKTATLTDSWACPPLKAITFQSKPMLQVAVEPINPSDMLVVEMGMKSLYQFDPVVEIGVDSTNGQRTMTCLGELHLDQCVKALREKFAKCELKVSEPLVTYRETIVPYDRSETNVLSVDGNSNELKMPPPWSDLFALKRARGGRVRYSIDSRNIAVTVSAWSVPITAASVMEQDITAINAFDESLYQSFFGPEESRNALFESSTPLQQKIWQQFIQKLSEDESKSYTANTNLVPSTKAGWQDRLVTVGPRSCPTNFLLFSEDCNVEIWRHALLPLLDKLLLKTNNSHGKSEEEENENEVIDTVAVPEKLAQFTRQSHASIFHQVWQRLHSGIVAGFHEATQAGPLMNETMHGMCFVFEKVELLLPFAEAVLSVDDFLEIGMPPTESSLTGNPSQQNIFVGQLISETKEQLKAAMLSCPAAIRLVEPIFQCDLQCDQAQLGNLYAVLSKRRGNVFREDIIEGTNLFLLFAHLPVASSFHFAQELLKKTSGSGTAPQLSFSHWMLMQADPFWRPRTEDELEEFGEEYSDEHNLARNTITQVRKRKGLAVDEQVVVSAEKQRTLNKKK